MRELVCLDMPSGAQLVDRIKRAWDNGDAIFPLDQRLPASAKKDLLDHVRPTIVATRDEENRFDNGQPAEDGDAVVVATSGSTGNPKAAVLTHDAIRASAIAVHKRLGTTSEDKWYACLPVSHVGGLSVITRSLVTGAALLADESFSVDAYNKAADDGCTLVSLVSTAMRRVDTRRFRWIVLGGSKPPLDRPSNSIATYGMTETGSGVVYDGLPLEGVEILIRDNVVHLRCPMLMRGYRDGTSPIDSEGWFRTGDIGRLSADGLLTVDGREGDLIITGGENVWPEVVEGAISTFPGVRDVCVAGIPDPEWGHAVCAWVVTDDAPTLDTVRQHVKESLPAYCAPRQMFVVPEIPRTALGKPRRNYLVDNFKN